MTSHKTYSCPPPPDAVRVRVTENNNKKSIAFAQNIANLANIGSKKKKKAFTLAEVLITLGIIGIIAALTLPALTAKYQKHSTMVQVKKAYAELYQAIKLSEVDNGSAKYWDFNLADDTSYDDANTKEVVEKYILPYLKGVAYCDTGMVNDKCAVIVGAGTGARNYILANGALLSIVSYYKSNSIVFQIATRPYTKKPIIGKNKFAFKLKYGDDKLLPQYWEENLTREDVINGFKPEDKDYTVACNPDSDSDYPRHACTLLLFMDNWEFKDDYPW